MKNESKLSKKQMKSVYGGTEVNPKTGEKISIPVPPPTGGSN